VIAEITPISPSRFAAASTSRLDTARILGDIGVPRGPASMNFSAWFETYLDHRWLVFEAHHNRPGIGRVLVGRRRDAGDVPLSNIFRDDRDEAFKVWTDEVD
jgi:hypothetical protein